MVVQFPSSFVTFATTLLKKASTQNYLIPQASEGERHDVIVGHSECTGRFEKRQLGSGVNYGNMSVGHLLYCLVGNMGIIWRPRASPLRFFLASHSEKECPAKLVHQL